MSGFSWGKEVGDSLRNKAPGQKGEGDKGVPSGEAKEGAEAKRPERRPEVDSLNGTVGRRPQVKLRSRARHWSGCTPRPIEFEHRALDLRLT